MTATPTRDQTSDQTSIRPLPIPKGATSASAVSRAIRSDAGCLTRRNLLLWTDARGDVQIVTPTATRAQAAAASRARRILLRRGYTVDVFHAPSAPNAPVRHGYVLTVSQGNLR